MFFKVKRNLFKFVTILLLTSITYPLKAQSSYAEVNKKIIPQPPNVASLLKFNEIPVTYFNGTADISIPLFDSKQGAVDIPMSLSYHTGGLKVAEEASWVGLGWNLNVGGIIQEIIVGYRDDEGGTHGFYMDDYNAAPKPNSAINYPTIYGDFNNSANVVEAGLCYRNAAGVVTTFAKDNLNKSNFEYDLFSFNFNGYSGKCIFPDLANGVCLDKQNIVFTKMPLNATTSIKAVTPDGTEYYFNLIGITSTPSCSPADPLPLQSRTWYLTQIVYPDKRTVNFTYNQTTSRSFPTLSENLSRTEFQDYQGYSTSSKSFSMNYSTVENYWLYEINFENGLIRFNSSARDDMENARKLDSIQLFGLGNLSTPIKKILFNYSYFNGYFLGVGNDYTTNTAFTNGGNPCNIFVPTSDWKTKRLKLDKVSILKPDDRAKSPSYFLEYNNTPLPGKTSLSQDLWGYYNSENNTTTLLPDYNSLGYWDPNVPYMALSATLGPIGLAKRAANENVNQCGMLTKMTYPTGGYSLFTYESNKITNQGYSIPSVVNASQKVTDHGTGIQQIQFNVPSIGYQGYDPQSNIYFDANPAQIHVTLFCCGSNGFNTSGALTCTSSYGPCSVYDALHPNWGLYARLEYFNTQTNQWTITPQHNYDLSNSSIGLNHGEIYINESLKPGLYRITANYPDNSPTLGDYSQTISEIMVSYKDIQSVANNNPYSVVGGLRMKNIADYSFNGNIAFQRDFNYTNGKLMVNPVFYNYYEPILNVSSTLSANCSDNQMYDTDQSDIRSCEGCGQGFNPPAAPVAYKQYFLYSNPVTPYSYSAKGALIGYESVSVKYGGNDNGGKTIYSYNCLPDNYNVFLNEESPGIPSLPNILNGTLKSEIQFKKQNNQSNPFSEIKSTVYEYNSLGNLLWCFKSEYHKPYSYGCKLGGLINCSMLQVDSKYYVMQLQLHFYPIKIGKLNLIKKTETLTDENNNSITQVSNFEYNQKFQTQKVSTTNSQGKPIVTETYYPSDYSTTTDFTKNMRDRNMLDYPVEVISKMNGLAVNANYNQYYLHDNMMSLMNVFKINPVNPVTIAPSIPGNIKDAAYGPMPEFNIQYNAIGNIVETNKQNDIHEVYLWDYNHAYAVAKITNSNFNSVAFSSFEADETGGWFGINNAYIISDVNSITGKRHYNQTAFTLSNTALLSTQNYTVSYWTKNATAFAVSGTLAGWPKKGQTGTLNGQAWTYYEHQVAGNTSVSVTGSGTIDELRLYPADAQMTTYTYELLVGLKSACDVNNKVNYYEYDSLKRLLRIRDQDGNILKVFDYKYQQ